MEIVAGMGQESNLAIRRRLDQAIRRDPHGAWAAFIQYNAKFVR